MQSEPERRRGSGRLTPPDRALLAFAAEQRLINVAHAAALLGASTTAARRRLRRLTGRGWLQEDTALAARPTYRATRSGLAVVGSALEPPGRPRLGEHDHDVGMAWVWLAAQRGAFGPVRAMAGERHMRSADRREEDHHAHLAVRVPGAGPRGESRRHYPDLLLDTAGGHRVAVELELTGKGRRRREEILGAYALDPRIDAVLYLVTDARTGRAIERTARGLGIGARVHVQMARLGPGSGTIRDPSLERVRPDRGATAVATEAAPGGRDR